jgi:GTP-binding protein
VTLDLDEKPQDMKPLLDTILHRVLPPVADVEQPFQMLVTMLDYDSYVGQISTGRVVHGKVAVGETVALVKRNGDVKRSRVTKILKYQGLKRIEDDRGEAGDILSIAGINEVNVGDTLASAEYPVALNTIHIDEPTISMNFSHNKSPFAGKDGGRFLTSRHIRERLMHEAMMNVGIRVEEVEGGESVKVSGRGELHLEILIETMRREGYEFEVSRPKVILKKDGDEILEPVEEVVIDVDPEYQGAVIAALGSRLGELKVLQPSAVGTVRMEFLIASRALIGFRNDFLTMTRGTGILYQNFYEYQKYKGELPHRQAGVQISQQKGKAVAYALWGLQERGEIFIHPGDETYEGMIIGVSNKGKDMVVNAQREKKLTNMRAAGSDEAIRLIPVREMTLEFALEFIEDDELVEITPKNIRLRKRLISGYDRKVAAKRALAA